jgi:hypothetical protein
MTVDRGGGFDMSRIEQLLSEIVAHAWSGGKQEAMGNKKLSNNYWGWCMELPIIKVKEDGWDYEFTFAVTRYVCGFGFSTPNYITGYYLNPLSALKNFMVFASKRDKKCTAIER